MYDSKQPTKDEKQIKDFMVAKYEKKMYYSDPVSQKLKNGFQAPAVITPVTTAYQVNIKYISISFFFLLRNQFELIYYYDLLLFIIIYNFIYTLQKPNDITTPAINISSPNKFEFLNEEPPTQNQSPIQTTQSFANFDNNPAFSTSFDTPKSIGMYNIITQFKIVKYIKYCNDPVNSILHFYI